eukprot:4685370-Pleurochrysis_carterae.AAC.1
MGIAQNLRTNTTLTSIQFVDQTDLGPHGLSDQDLRYDTLDEALFEILESNETLEQLCFSGTTTQCRASGRRDEIRMQWRAEAASRVLSFACGALYSHGCDILPRRGLTRGCPCRPRFSRN